jgi:nitrogen fixation NifU-like protein
MVVIYLTIDENTQKITDASFESYGGAANIAVSSIVTSMLKGKFLDEAWKISSDQISNELDGFPVDKHPCGFLVISALQWSVRDYYQDRKKPNWFPNHLTSDEKRVLEKEKLSEILSKKYSRLIK